MNRLWIDYELIIIKSSLCQMFAKYSLFMYLLAFKLTNKYIINDKK